MSVRSRIIPFSVLTVAALSQVRLIVNPSQTCNYEAGGRKAVALYGFEPDDQAKAFVENIMRYSGLQQNFIIIWVRLLWNDG